MIHKINFVTVTKDNISDIGIYCIKDKKSPGFKNKVAWYKHKLNQGLRIIIVTDQNEKQLGFIEYLPSEAAWRPINAEHYLFIQCIALFGKEARNQSIGSQLIEICEQEALKSNKKGVCAMTSDGTWMANNKIFKLNKYHLADELGRFQLMYKAFKKNDDKPKFHDWINQQSKYKGWNLIYSDQCPWHEKAVIALYNSAQDHNIDLKIKKLKTPKQAQKAPSGFGTFSLINDGKLLADHYISKTRFENILRNEGYV